MSSDSSGSGSGSGSGFDPNMPPRSSTTKSESSITPLRDLPSGERAARLRALDERVNEGGGAAAVAKLHARGKLTGWERVEMLCDPGSFEELDKLVGSLRGVIRGNTITGHGKIDGRPVVVVSNMSESKAGAWFGESVFKMLRAQEFSYEHRIPLIMLIDSASAYLPEQEDVHSGFRHGGRVFHYLARHSGLFPQVAAVLGWSVAGGAYVPGLCDFAPMVVKQSAMFLAGPKLVQAAIGESVTIEDLGGARLHCRESGVGDLECVDEATCLRSIRTFLSYLPTNHTMPAPRSPRSASPLAGASGNNDDSPTRSTPEIASIIPSEARRAYDVREVINVVADRGSIFELRPHFGSQIVVAFGRLDGRSCGFVASQPKHLGGIIDADAADKAAWFISMCDAFNVPLVFFQDVPGFMVGSKAEKSGIIHAGARMIQAMSRARVPRFTVVLRKAFGAGQYAMCGPGFEPTRIFGLPTAETGTMAPQQLEDVVYGEAIAMARSEEARSAIERERDAVVAHHRHALGADYAASKGWYDGIIQPEDLRRTLVRSLELSANHLAAHPMEGRRAICLT